MGGKIGSGLTVPDLGETSPISSPVRFAFTLHKYATSLAPPLLTLPVLALPSLSRRQSREPREEEMKEVRQRERERLTVVVEPSTALMAGDIVVIEADPWDPSDVTVEMLQSLVDGGLLRPVTDPNRPEWIAPLGEPEPRPHDGYVVSFVSFHEHGLSVPADRFMRALPHYYGVELHNFNPNSVA